MIFSIGDHIEQIKAGNKTQTRRPNDRYKVGNLYAVQPGRGKKGIPDGKIFIAWKKREWKPDLSGIPKAARFSRTWRQWEAGYPLHERDARAEGGYTVEEFEELYEKMYPHWEERWVLYFSFFTAEEIEEVRSCT